jgi:protein-S-isoprenylcysteine O-methyltransferase Ste14
MTMMLIDEFAQWGQRLFRWRSYLPLILFIVFFAGLHSGAYRPHFGWELFCLAVAFAGLAVRGYTIGHTPRNTSGRNTKTQIADELNTSGIYSLIRHPLYSGNFLMGLGTALFTQCWWVVVIYALAFGLYYERIMCAEEAFLQEKFGAVFVEWTTATPVLWPKFAHWRKPNLPFALRNVLKREYSGLFGMIASFTVLKLVGDFFAVGRLSWSPFWIALFGVGTLIYVTLRTLRKTTSFLDVPGR